MLDYKGCDGTDFVNDGMQHYILKPEGEPSEDTFDMMTTIAAFLRYSELRYEKIERQLAIFAGLSIAVCVAGGLFTSHLYVLKEINHTTYMALRIIVICLGVFFTGFSFERRASIRAFCDEMLYILGTEGVVVTKKMEEEYRKNTSSVLQIGSIKLKIQWDKDYFKECGLDEKIRLIE